MLVDEVCQARAVDVPANENMADVLQLEDDMVVKAPPLIGHLQADRGIALA